MNFSPEKLLLVGVVALVVLGPSRLPQAARTLGRFLAELRRMSTSFQTEIRDAVAEPRDALNGAMGDLGLGELRQSFRGSVSEMTNIFTEPVRTATTPGGTPTTSTSSTSGVPGGAPATPTVGSLPPAPDDPALN